MTDEKTTSSDSRRVQMTVKLSARHMELIDRLRIIYGVGRTNLLYRTLVEYLVTQGFEIPGIAEKDLRTPRMQGTNKTIERLSADLDAYCAWLAEALATSVGARRGVRIYQHTRMQLAHRVASWPALPRLDGIATAPPLPASTISVTHSGLSSIPQALFLPNTQADAVRMAADQVGSFSDLLRSSLDAFAQTYGLADPSATTPVFSRFPPPPLAQALRSYEEPCLAVLYAMSLIDKREDRAGAHTGPGIDSLFRSLMLMAHTDVPDDV